MLYFLMKYFLKRKKIKGVWDWRQQKQIVDNKG